MEKIATCIKETGNWSKLEKYHRFDNPEFSSDKVVQDIETSAPKLKALMDKIKELDKQDMKKHGKLFKHFIYSDVKSAYGAKLIAGALASHGFTHAYGLKKTSKGKSFKMASNLQQYKGQVFATLTSTLFFEKPIGIRFRRDLLSTFNKRPDNIYGEEIRIIILDSGFREGIDLFDVKYVHLFEPMLTKADQKQAIGRATRFCGQKGLHFEKNVGWPLYVYRYETILTPTMQKALKDICPCDTFFNLFMKFSNIDPTKINFANELEPVVIFSAVDRYLTRHVHNFQMEDLTQNRQFNEIFKGGGGGALSKFSKMQKYVREKFSKFQWAPTKIENGCEFKMPAPGNNKGPAVIQLSPTQDFLRTFFTHKSPQKGMLLMHSVGAGKTCSAIAVGSSSFEREDWTIIYVTRHTLKADVWKNMFGATCSAIIKEMIEKGIPIPDAESKRQKLIKAWMEPMSYKQLSNALEGKNSFHGELVARNGKKDLLHKTLIIIDEAHKMYAPDVSGGEKPNIDAIKDALDKSYRLSGKDSAKLLLMTATPYTDDPMDMMKLMNLMRERDEQLPEAFDDFQAKYLDDQGKFTGKGRIKFIDEMTGYISYLNRERDVRSFAYPIIEDIHIPMSEYEFKVDLDRFDYVRTDYDQKKLLYEIRKSDLQKEIINMRVKLNTNLDKSMEGKKKDIETCVETFREFLDSKRKELSNSRAVHEKKCSVYRQECIDKIKKAYKEQEITIATDMDCKEKEKECKQNAKQASKDNISDLKAQAKEDTKKCGKKDGECKEKIKQRLNDEIAEVKAEEKAQVEKCKEELKKCKQMVKDKVKDKKLDMKEDQKFDVSECDNIDVYRTCREAATKAFEQGMEAAKRNSPCLEKTEQLNKYEKLQKQIIQTKVEEFANKSHKDIDIAKEKYDEKKKAWEDLYNKIVLGGKTDKSQQLKLENCLKTQKVKPLYEQLLKGKVVNEIVDDDDGSNDEPVGEKVANANIYIVNGHGGEDLNDFSKRSTMPDDKVLVVFPVCGKANYLSTICKFMDIFNDPKNIKWMMDPIKYQGQIEEALHYPLRIFLPGDKVPFLTTNMFLDFEFPGKVVLAKSGVMEVANIPAINRKKLEGTNNMKYSLGHTSCFKYNGIIDDPTKYTMSVHNELFKGNKYDKAAIPQGYSQMKHRKFKVTDILNDMGPGIYFYTGCRAANADIPDDKYEKLLIQSASQQDQKDRNEMMKKFKPNLKVEYKGEEIESDSDSDKDSENEDTDEQKTEEEDKKEKKDTMTKEERSKLRSVTAEYKQMLMGLLHMTEAEKKASIDKLKEWLNSVKGLTAKIQQEMAAIVEILSDKVGSREVLQVSKVGKQYNVYISKEFKMDKKRYVFKGKELGVLPAGNKNAQLKCSTENIISRMKILFKKGDIDKLGKILPKKIEEYNKSRDVFAEVCRRVRLAGDDNA